MLPHTHFLSIFVHLSLVQNSAQYYKQPTVGFSVENYSRRPQMCVFVCVNIHSVCDVSRAKE